MAEIDRRKGYNPQTIKIYDKKKNLEYKEISLIAVDKTDNRILAAGNDALSYRYSPKDNVVVASPLKYGKIADYAVAQAMFQHMLKKAKLLHPVFKPEIIVCIPTDITDVECKALQDIFYQSGARKVILSELSADELKKNPSSYNVIVEIVQDEEVKPSGEEKWTEVLKGLIPPAPYQSITLATENHCIVITLSCDSHRTKLEFQNVAAVRMLDKNIVPENLHALSELERYRGEKFKNIIYEIENGEFYNMIKENDSGKVLTLNLRHFIIISGIYIVEVLSEEEPAIF